MTADEFMPVFITMGQSIITALDNAYIFENLSMLDIYISLFALSIIAELIHYIQYGEWFPVLDEAQYRGK